jgi:ABC-type branched-subunit amino acid transport system substrate-binding protein
VNSLQPAPPRSARRDRISRGAARPGASVKIGLIHPVSGFIAFSGNQCREGALMAIADINAAGGIKSMGGAHA